MDDAFALIDFALIAASPEVTAQALGQAVAQVDAADGSTRRNARSLGRLLSRSLSDAERGPLRIQPRSSLGPTPLIHATIEDVAREARTYRLSGPLADGLTLIELQEGHHETSPVCAALSGILREVEVFFFRVSGASHPGAHYAFHVYSNGLATRRAASISARGDHAEADWQSMDAGIFHPLETDSLTTLGTPDSRIMTPERQASILEALGLVPDQLFDDIPDRGTVLILSPAEGGFPLSEAALRGGPRLRPAASFPEASTDAKEPASSLRGGFTEAPSEHAFRAPPAFADFNYPEPVQTATVTQLEPIADPEPDPEQALESMDIGPRDAPEPPAAITWEAEVMALLVDAVEHALPADQQVPWLDALTARLNEGLIVEALADAQFLILHSDRPEAERLRLSHRLATLFVPDSA